MGAQVGRERGAEERRHELREAVTPQIDEARDLGAQVLRREAAHVAERHLRGERGAGWRRLRRRRHLLERGRHLLHVLEALAGALRHAAMDEVPDPRRERQPESSHVRGLRVEVALHRVGDGVAREGQLAHEQLVRDHAERVDVRARVDRLPQPLLRRHVVGGPEDVSLVREADPAPLGHGLGEPEVEQRDVLSSARVHHDVLGLEVTVHHSQRVRARHARRDLPEQRERALGPEATLVHDQVSERAPLEQLHDEVVEALGREAELVDADHVRVVEHARRARLPGEARDGQVAVGGVRLQHLHRHLAAEVRGVGQIHHADAAPTELGDDLVAALDRVALGQLAAFERAAAEVRDGGAVIGAEADVSDVAPAVGADPHAPDFLRSWWASSSSRAR
ncbi:MAG: hypothetical protein RLP09_10980 [Sandaracinaceae bacterium]